MPATRKGDHIKRVGKYFGADIVGIGRAHPALLYAGGTLRDTGFITEPEDGPHEPPLELCQKYPYVITLPPRTNCMATTAHAKICMAIPGRWRWWCAARI